MSTYANIRIEGCDFHCTYDGVKENIVEELKPYIKRAKQIAKPGYIPEVAVALIALDAYDYYSFFQFGTQEWGHEYEVKIGPRGGVICIKQKTVDP